MLSVSACLMMTFAMGALHAFSTLLEGIERQAEVGRMAASLVYSSGLICVTVAVFFGHLLYRHWSAPRIALLAATLPLLGMGVVAHGSWLGWMVGHGVVFGLASGVGYGFSLHAASCAVPRQRRGTALGAVTAFYALGAIGFSLLYPALFEWIGFQTGYGAGSVLIALLAAGSAWLWHTSGLDTKSIGDSSAPPTPALQHTTYDFLRLWLGYGTGVFAGLMVLGHAVPMIKAVDGSSVAATTTLACMSLGNGLAGLGAGWLADRFGCKTPLLVIMLTSALTLMSLSLATKAALVAPLIVLVSTCYGAFIAIYPTLVATWFGAARAAWAYGRVFTAWGLAGLAAPPLAGWLFERTDGYGMPLMLAALLACGAGGIIAWFPKNSFFRYATLR